MKNLNKLAALILALLMLVSATTAFAGIYISDPVSPFIQNPSASQEPGELRAESTPTPESTEGLEPTASPELAETAEPTVTPELAETPAPELQGTVTTSSDTSRVNIRAAASIDAEILGQLDNSARVTVLGVEGDWVNIRTGDIVGYVNSKYLAIDTETAAPEETPSPEDTPAPERSIKIHDNVGSMVHYGDQITLTGVLTGYDDLSYALQWQIRDDGGSWRDISGANDTSYSFELSADNATSEWRLVVDIG